MLQRLEELASDEFVKDKERVKYHESQPSSPCLNEANLAEGEARLFARVATARAEGEVEPENDLVEVEGWRGGIGREDCLLLPEEKRMFRLTFFDSIRLANSYNKFAVLG